MKDIMSIITKIIDKSIKKTVKHYKKIEDNTLTIQEKKLTTILLYALIVEKIIKDTGLEKEYKKIKKIIGEK